MTEIIFGPYSNVLLRIKVIFSKIHKKTGEKQRFKLLLFFQQYHIPMKNYFAFKM